MGSDERAAAVIAGVPQYTSVSALQRLRRCEASWWFRYVARLPDPPGPGAKLGTKLHAELEHYYKTGENVLGEIPRRGLHVLPTPGPGIVSETQFGPESGLVLDADGIPMQGFVDLIDTRRDTSDALGAVRLVDFKFKKDPVKYGTSPEKLASLANDDGLQMGAYAAAAFPKYRDLTNYVRLEHIHFSTGKPVPAKSIHVDLPFDKTAHRWPAVAGPLGQRLRQVAAAASADAVNGNREACFAYGGCPYRSHCPHYNSTKPEDKEARLKSLLLLNTAVPLAATSGRKVSTMGMLNRMLKTEAKAETTAAMAETPTGETALSPQQKAALERFEAREALGTVAGGPGTLEATRPPVAAVLPPDAPASALPVPVAQAAAADSIGGEATKPRRGRPKKDSSASTTPAPAAPVVSPTPAPAAPVADASHATHLAAHAIILEQMPKVVYRDPPPPGFSLYLRGTPTKSPAEPFADYVSGIEGLALEKFRNELKVELTDVRLSEGSVIGYGRWQIVLEELAKENPPTPGNYLVNLGDSRTDCVFRALEKLAVEVVR